MSTPVLHYVILFGPPGSGKGTQAKLLANKLPEFRHISTGDLFRKEISSKSELGLKIEGILKSGSLVSDDVTCEVFRSQLQTMLPKNGGKMVFLLDGFPRTANQANYLVKLIGEKSFFGKLKTIELRVSQDKLIERLSNRLVNPKSGKVYHAIYNPPKKAGICDEDGTALIQRDDDKVETIKKRFALYIEQKEAVLKVLKLAGVTICEISGEGDMDQITEVIQKELNKS